MYMSYILDFRERGRLRTIYYSSSSLKKHKTFEENNSFLSQNSQSNVAKLMQLIRNYSIK